MKVPTARFLSLLSVIALLGFLPAPAASQIHIWIDVPSGKTYSETEPTPPTVTVENAGMEEDTALADLTPSSFYSPSSSSTTDAVDWASEYVGVKVNIPKAGDWHVFVHYITPTVGLNSFFCVNQEEMYIGGPTGPSADPVAFLDVDTPRGGGWVWAGAPLGSLKAGEYTLYFYKREVTYGTSGEAAKPEDNPHIELVYLTNGGANDVPTDALFNKTQPFTAQRSFTPTGFTRFGGTIGVTITVTPGTVTGGPAATVTETLIRGFTAKNIVTSTGSATFAGAAATITWQIPSLTKAETMTYTFDVVAGRTDPIDLSGNISAAGVERRTSGLSSVELISFRIAEMFSYPLGGEANQNKGKSITAVDQQRGWGWVGGWSVTAPAKETLDERQLDAGLIQTQPIATNPGNFSLKLTGNSGDDAVRRSFNPISEGECWLSFSFLDEGPAANHWAGVSFFDTEGNEVSFVGKPWAAQYAGIANLPGGDSLATGVDYKQPHHYLVRYLLKSGPGQNDSVYLWIDPDKNDRFDTYDAGGSNNDNITNLATLRFARGEGSGSAYLDNIWIDSVPALPPAGAGRVDLKLDDPKRPEELPAFDVVCIDQWDDTVYTGEFGFGHDTGENYYLIVTGCIYWNSYSNPTTQIVGYGLPIDHMSGLNGHILGPYNMQALDLGLKNSMKFENTDEQYGPFTFDVVPPGKYQELRAVMTIGNGDGQIFATFNYKDGTTSAGFFHADDWYDDPPGLRFPDVFQLVNDMNRLDGGNNFDARFDPAFFENPAAVDPNKELISVTLEFDPSVANCAFNLFDILAIPVPVVPVGVSDWMLL